MEGKRFDSVARGLAQRRTRRGIFGTLGAATLVLAGGPSAFAAKHRKAKNKSDDSGGGDSPIPGTQVGGIWDETIAICHFDAESGEVEVMEVSTPTVPQYLNAGDTLYMDCCVDVDCPKRLCLTSTGCIEGACSYDTAAGEACGMGDGTTGVCDKNAKCVSSGVTEAPIVG
jgi:hypothetical protein